MANTVLFIDGENAKHYIERILVQNKISKQTINYENFNFEKLFNTALKGIDVDEKRYYCAKIRYNSESSIKSKELILKQRILKSKLENSGIRVVVSGNVRAQNITVNGKKSVIFHEKGVDVKIGVDLVANACDKEIKLAILCSSDSDLQPAVKEIVNRGVEVIYLGFESFPNKGLIYTTQRTILIRNSEVMESYSH